MRCKDIERLIIDSSDEDLSQEELTAIEKHVTRCASCARFRDDLEKIRMGIKVMPQPVVPPDLAQKTRLRIHTEMGREPAAATKIDQLTPSESIPKYVWVALLPLIILTVILIVPIFKEIRLDQTLTFASVVALTIIIQNAVMLLFAPILIRRYRGKKQDTRGIPMNANAT
jgi:hypothetical protein